MAEEERKRPFAIEQAKREIETARDNLSLAQERGYGIEEAQQRLDEAEQALVDLRAGTKEERKEARKEFVQERFQQLGPYIVGLVQDNKILRDVVFEAIANNWTQQKFLSDQRIVDWLGSQGPFAKQMIAIEFDPTRKTEWEDLLKNARNAVLDVADQYNLSLSQETIDQLSRRFLYSGWDKNPRDLEVWMADKVRQKVSNERYGVGGDVLSNQRRLENIARDFGFQPDNTDFFFNSAVDIMDPSKRTSETDIVQQMIDAAEELYPVFKGQLSSDNSLRQAASRYISGMSNILEIDVDSIDLRDDVFQKAFNSQMDEQGNPSRMSYYDFEKELRKDPRWQKTTNARGLMSNVAMTIARAFGGAA